MLSNYGKLSEMISFFNQRFHMEQLVTYGFKFLHEKLSLKNSAIYIKHKKEYRLENKLGYDDIPSKIDDNPVLGRIATLHGKLLIYSFNRYFKDEFIEVTDMTIIIPLIVKSELVGFIVSDGIEGDELSPEKIELMEKANILMNNAVTIVKREYDYKEMSRTLDKDIFGLLFINKSTHLLLSEVDEDKIHTMCVDMIRELTTSKITSLGLFNDEKNVMELKGYHDVYSSEKKYFELELVDSKLTPSKIIFDIKRDEMELKSIFKDISELKNIEAKYIILIVKEKENILGFISISEAINNQEYDRSTFEMIESMASSIYISLKNSKYIKQLQKK